MNAVISGVISPQGDGASPVSDRQNSGYPKYASRPSARPASSSGRPAATTRPFEST
jgi:hypothetical protein